MSTIETINRYVRPGLGYTAAALAVFVPVQIALHVLYGVSPLKAYLPLVVLPVFTFTVIAFFQVAHETMYPRCQRECCKRSR